MYNKIFGEIVIIINKIRLEDLQHYVLGSIYQLFGTIVFEPNVDGKRGEVKLKRLVLFEYMCASIYRNNTNILTLLSFSSLFLLLN